MISRSHDSITLGLLKDIKSLGCYAAWIQPGAADDAVEKYIVEAGLESKVVWGGPCILVNGEGLGMVKSNL